MSIKSIPFAGALLSATVLTTTSFALECPRDEFQTPGAIGARIFIQEMHALKVTDDRRGTEGDRDEVFIRVLGRTSRGGTDARLPRSNDSDEYYQFWDGFIANANNPHSWTTGHRHGAYFPQIWEGLLPAYGDRAEFLLVVLESDANPLRSAKPILDGIFSACGHVAGGIDNPYAKIVEGACKGANSLVGIIPEHEDTQLIGAFLVSVENNGGELQTTYLVADGAGFDAAGPAATTLVTADGDPFLSVLQRELGGNAVRISTVGSGGFGRYDLTVIAEPACVGVASAGQRRVVWNDDVERGNCDGGKPVGVRKSDGTFRPVRVGESFYLLGDGNRHIEYTCDGDYEEEQNLFERNYPEFIVERTPDKVNYYPLTYEPYGITSAIGRARAELSAAPKIDSPNLSRARGITRVTWSPASGARTNGGIGFEQPRAVIDGLVQENGGWRVEKHPRMLGDVNGDGRADIVGLGNYQVFVALGKADGSFTAPRPVIDDLAYENGGWRVDKHPRMLGDVNGDGRADIVGFGNYQVFVALGRPDGTFGAVQAIVDGLAHENGGWRVEKHPRMLSDVNGDGRDDIVAFGNHQVFVARALGAQEVALADDDDR